jgi:hypothetical protein
VTAFLDLTAAVRDALTAPPALAGGRVYRGRRVPLATAESASIHVNALRHAGRTLSMDGGATQWETQVAVELRTRAAAGVDAEAALDPHLTAVWDRLKAMPVPAGAAAVALDPEIRIDFDEQDHTLAIAEMGLRFTHITTAGALAA